MTHLTELPDNLMKALYVAIKETDPRFATLDAETKGWTLLNRKADLLAHYNALLASGKARIETRDDQLARYGCAGPDRLIIELE